MDPTNPAGTQIHLPGGGGQPTPTGGQVAPPTIPPVAEPAINLDSKIQVDGKTFTVKQLMDEAAKVEQIQKQSTEFQTRWKHTERLLDADNQDPALKEESMRYLLNARGYSPEEIEDAVSQALAAQNQPQPGEYQEQAPPRNQRGGPPQPTMQDMNYEELNLMREKIALMEQEQQKAKLNTLKRELASSTTNLLDSNPKLRTLVQKLKELRGDDGIQESLEALRADIQDRTVKQLKLRTATTGQLVNDAWIAEEAEKAAELTYKHYLSVIGDPNKIGRAPETVTGEDVWSKKQPVQAPTYQKGDNMGTASIKLREFGVDALARLAAASETGGASKA